MNIINKHRSNQKILFFLLIVNIAFHSNNLYAQKTQLKSTIHQQKNINEKGILALSLQTKEEFNRFSKVTLQEYSRLDSKEKIQLEHQIRYSYDPKKRHQNTLEYNGNGILIKEHKIHWGDANNKIKTEEISYTDGQKTSIVVTYQLEYDDNENKEKENFFNSDGLLIKQKKWFYNKELEIKKVLTWADNKKEPRKETITSYKRNKMGDLMKSISKEKINGKIFRKDVFFFSNNYMVEWKKFINGKLESEFFNEYRDSVIIRTTRHNKRKIISITKAEKHKEKITQKKEKRKKKNILVTNNEYDIYGNIIVSTQSINDKIFFVTEYSYNNDGNKIKTIKHDKIKDTIHKELFVYDKQKKLTSKTVLKDDTIISKDIYQYEYFDIE